MSTRRQHLAPRLAAVVAAALLTAAAVSSLPSGLAAQSRPALQDPAALLANGKGKAALDSMRAWQGWTLDQQIQLTEIEAPPFKEQRRAEEFRRRLMAL